MEDLVMKLPKVKLRHKKTGEILKINEADWARDLGIGKYRDYERVGEIGTLRKEDMLEISTKSQVVQKAVEESSGSEDEEIISNDPADLTDTPTHSLSLGSDVIKEPEDQSVKDDNFIPVDEDKSTKTSARRRIRKGLIK